MNNLIAQIEAMAAGIEALTPYAVKSRSPFNKSFLQQHPKFNELEGSAKEFRNFWFELLGSVILNTEIAGATRFNYRSTVTLSVVHSRFANTRIDRTSNTELQQTYIMMDAHQLAQYIITESTRVSCSVHHISEPQISITQLNAEDRLLVITFDVEHEET